MSRYLARRLVQAIPTIFGVTLISFLLMMATPGDPITIITFNPSSDPESTMILRRQLGLDQPALTQYLYWLVGNDWVHIDVDGDGDGDMYGKRQGFLRGDLGQSLKYKYSVTALILQRVLPTLQLGLAAVLIGYGLGIPLGLLSAVYHRSWFDQLARVISVVGNAVPSFWLALLLIILFSVNLGWLPMSGMFDITKNSATVTILDTIPYMVMPVVVLSLGIVASVSRFTRAQVLESMEQDYVRTAYAKGLSDRRVRWNHIIPNTLIPAATLLGPALGTILSGAVVIEQTFSWPGMGRLVIDAVFQRDYPLIMGSVVLGAVLYILGVLISDILYAVLDPRIRFG
jgi:peptide/nickel transport system permease protein